MMGRFGEPTTRRGFFWRLATAAGLVTLVGCDDSMTGSDTEGSANISVSGTGGFQRLATDISYRVEAENPIERVEVYFNDGLIESESVISGRLYSGSTSFTPENAGDGELKIKVIEKGGMESTKVDSVSVQRTFRREAYLRHADNTNTPFLGGGHVAVSLDGLETSNKLAVDPNMTYNVAPDPKGKIVFYTPGSDEVEITLTHHLDGAEEEFSALSSENNREVRTIPDVNHGMAWKRGNVVQFPAEDTVSSYFVISKTSTVNIPGAPTGLWGTYKAFGNLNGGHVSPQWNKLKSGGQISIPVYVKSDVVFPKTDDDQAGRPVVEGAFQHYASVLSQAAGIPVSFDFRTGVPDSNERFAYVVEMHDDDSWSNAPRSFKSDLDEETGVQSRAIVYVPKESRGGVTKRSTVLEELWEALNFYEIQNDGQRILNPGGQTYRSAAVRLARVKMNSGPRGRSGLMANVRKMWSGLQNLYATATGTKPKNLVSSQPRTMYFT